MSSFDKLIDPRVLDLAPARARRIDVGKRCGRHAMSQAAINRLLVAQVKAGGHVVRLKGGDPFVFGRGGERRGDAGHHLDRGAGLAQGFQFLPAAAEDEGVAALETHHMAAGPHLRHQ